jgi:AcrR family transcriptional regulator
MAASKKIELIQKTYELLKDTAPDDLKIRDIAKACSCTPTVVYKHFEDLDDLIRFGCVHFLEDYIRETMKIVNENMDPLEMLIIMWDEFSKCAFKNVDVYLHLFWGRYRSQLGDTIFDYYHLFPDHWQVMGGLFTSTFFNSEIKERNYTIVRRASAVGYFHHTETKLISDMQCYLMHGILMDYRDSYRQPGKAEEGQKLFMQTLRSQIQHYCIK